MKEEPKYVSESKLDIKTFFSVFFGIILVFSLMPFVNTIIFYNVIEQKLAYYLSLLVSNSLFFFLILIIKFSKRLSWTDLGWKTIQLKDGVKSVLKVWAITMLINIIYMFTLLARGIIPPENELFELLVSPTLGMFIFNVLLIAVIAPIIEETLFRAILLRSLRKYCGIWTAVIISSVIFSALHMEMFGFIPRLALGIGLGYLYEKYNSLLPAIGLHSFNNLLAVLAISFST